MHTIWSRFSPFVLALSFSLFVTSAYGQDADELDTLGQAPGVKRHALIIANQDYNMDGVIKIDSMTPPASGTLSDLKNPCRDAALFRAKLIEAKWKPEEIVYKGCNSTASEMREMMVNFGQLVATSTNTTFIMYFSGHGAQISDGETPHSFLFGVRANLDLNKVRDSVLNSPGSTAALNSDAVDIDDLLRTVGSQNNNALLLVLDACRNNIIYGQIEEADAQINVESLSRSNIEYPGVSIAYSTAAGEFSGDGVGENSIFTSSFASMLKSERTFDDIFNTLPRKVAQLYRAAYPNRTSSQEPRIRGRFNATWCVWACKPPQDSATVPAPMRTTMLSPRLIGLLYLPLPALADLQVLPDVAAALRGKSTNMFQAPIPKDAIAAPGMSIDIFVCVGGAGADERMKRAQHLADTLAYDGRFEQTSQRAKYSIESGRAGDATASVRIRPLSAVSNTAPGFRYAGDLAVVDLKDKVESLWAERLRVRSAAPLEIIDGKGRTPGYISVAICRDAGEPPSGVTTAYLQVPTSALKRQGNVLMARLAAALPGVKPADGIELRRDGPDRTELRYYFDQDRDRVFEAARTLETLLERPVRIQFLPRIASSASKGNMEIWLGKLDEPLPEALRVATPSPAT